MFQLFILILLIIFTGCSNTTESTQTSSSENSEQILSSEIQENSQGLDIGQNVELIQEWLCTVKHCEYVYDPSVGDPSQEIPPGTAFEDLPDDWKCPVCGKGKEVFIKI